MSNNNLFPSLVRLYHSTFNREADKQGIGHWAKQIDKNDFTLEDVAREFIGSEEFLSLYPDGISSEEFVTLIYNNVLGRDPDEIGLKFWVKTMENGWSREDILLGFSESEENQKNTEDDVNEELDELFEIEVSSGTKNGAQKIVLYDGVYETVTISDNSVKAQVHHVILGQDKVVFPVSLIESSSESGLSSEAELSYEGNSVLDLFSNDTIEISTVNEESLIDGAETDVSDDEEPVDADPEFQEWVDFFLADDKNKIEIEWSSDDSDDSDDSDGSDDSVGDGVEVELKIMYRDGFVKLHDVEIDAETFAGFDLADSGELTMHRDRQDYSLMKIDSETENFSVEMGEGAIQLVGYFIQEGLIDIANL